MKYYSKIPRTGSLIPDLIATWYNRILFYLAKKYAMGEFLSHGRRHYVLDVFDSYMIVSSKEKKVVNAKAPKGKRMEFNELLMHKVFMTPDPKDSHVKDLSGKA